MSPKEYWTRELDKFRETPDYNSLGDNKQRVENYHKLQEIVTNVLNFQEAGTGILLTLAGNVLAVKFWLVLYN